MILSLLPRKWLQQALWWQWWRTLSIDDRLRLDFRGTTGNPEHHPFSWADDIIPKSGK